MKYLEVEVGDSGHSPLRQFADSFVSANPLTFPPDIILSMRQLLWAPLALPFPRQRVERVVVGAKVLSLLFRHTNDATYTVLQVIRPAL